MKSAIINSKIFTGEKIIENKILLIENGEIISIQPEIPEGVDVVDLKGKNIAPGLIDIQVNGGEKYYFSQFPNQETLQDMSEACFKSGTAYFLPTLISSTHDGIFEAIENVKNFKRKNGSVVMGMHLEGPFFNPAKRGAHNKNIVRKPTDNELKEIIRYGQGIVKIITIAPEIFSEEQLEMLLESGIEISIGHSDMTYEQAQYYFSKGIHLVTHLFNAMSDFSHKAPGLVGAALENENVYTPVILDGYHNHFAAARIAYRLKKDKFLLVTDCAFIGRKVKSFNWENFDSTLIDGRYSNKEGHLSGSAISMAEAVRNAKEHLPCSMQEAIEMATSRVAKAIQMDTKIGFIRPGFPANFFVFGNDLNGKVLSFSKSYENSIHQ
jgi:N-acetylglucosamine-6-phosphate deacetylase